MLICLVLFRDCSGRGVQLHRFQTHVTEGLKLNSIVPVELPLLKRGPNTIFLSFQHLKKGFCYSSMVTMTGFCSGWNGGKESSCGRDGDSLGIVVTYGVCSSSLGEDPAAALPTHRISFCPSGLSPQPRGRCWGRPHPAIEA